MKKILFLSTPTRTYTPNSMIPAGVIQLAAFLREKGYCVDVLDIAHLRSSFKEVNGKIDNFKPDLIAVSGIITAYSYVVSLTRSLRTGNPSIPIVLGGQIVASNIDNCFANMEIDYAISGYGEIPLLKLVRFLERNCNIDDIPGLAYLRAGEIIQNNNREFVKSLDDLPLPAYDLIDMKYYTTAVGGGSTKLKDWAAKKNKQITNFNTATVYGSLGCSAKCTFCIHEQEYVGVKLCSNEYLINHIRYLYEKFDVRIFSIGEEMFIANHNKAKAFSALFSAEFPDACWRSATRSEFVNEKLLNILDTPESNCYSLGFGFESGSQQVLDLMNKGTLVEQNINAYRLIKQSKHLVGACSFMVGNIGETYRTVKETISAIKKTGAYNSIVFFTHPYPGGRIWDWACERNIIKDPHEYLMRVSNKDAAGDLDVNLTPYPNWMVKSWRSLVQAEIEKNCLRRREYFFKSLTWRRQLKTVLDSFFPAIAIIPIKTRFINRILNIRIPTILLKMIIKSYLLVWESLKSLGIIGVSQYELVVDEKGVILPKQLKIGRPPSFSKE